MKNEKNYFKQHRPAFFSGYENEEFYFDTLEELLANPIVYKWTLHPFYLDEEEPISNPEFYQFSLSDNRLMCELKNGYEWYVIGFVKFPERLGLPKWKAKRR